MSTTATATEQKIVQVVDACNRYGDRSVIALAGVPGTGKSFIGLLAAQQVASDLLMVDEAHFHPGTTYDQFIEGMRIDAGGATVINDGIFLEWNDAALADPDNTYVLLIEEFTRTDVSAVLGELMTYLEYRDRHFLTLYGRRRINVARNLRVIVTFNPTDRSALNLDAAILRRLRIIDFAPDETQLAEMLASSALPAPALAKLKQLFEACRKEFPDEYTSSMPFGHGIFAEVKKETPDLHELWNERIVKMLRRPLVEPHPFANFIQANYPWTDPAYVAP